MGRGATVDEGARALGPLPGALHAAPAAAQLSLPRDAEAALSHCGHALHAALPVCRECYKSFISIDEKGTF